MIPMKATTIKQAEIEAVAISKNNPGMYVTINATFGLFASLSKRLHVNSPTDSPMGIDWYVINGTMKKFSNKMRIADQRATPTMS